MQVQTVADITPNSTPTQISALHIDAYWIAITASGSTIRWGDVNVGSGRGNAIPTGTTVIIPRISFDQQGYDLSTVYVYGTGSDKVSISYGA